MDILERLRKDHDQVRVLSDRLQVAAGDDARHLLQELDAAVRVHARAEQELIYPKASEAPVMIEEDLVEHETIEQLLDGLRGLEPDGIAFRGRAKFLRENVHHHADDEEENLFPLLREAFDDATLERLGERFSARKAELQGPTKQQMFEEVNRS